MLKWIYKHFSIVFKSSHNTWKRFYLLLLVVSLLFIIIITRQVMRGAAFIYIGEVGSSENEPRFLVDTESCRMQYIDPYDKSIEAWTTAHNAINCKGKSVTYQVDRFIKLDWKVVELVFGANFDFCEYEGINRGDNTDDDMYYFTEKKTKFTNDIRTEEEFVRVKCFNTSRGHIYTNYHAFIVKNTEKLEELQPKLRLHKYNNKPQEILNVVMIGIDSTSRLNHERHMPKTRDYLLRHLSAIELQGYTKVADNTFLNIVPITTGKFVEELPWDIRSSSKPFDNFNFIWKNFSDQGYTTLYSEDAPHGAIFNYVKKGFHTPPADHYSRPFSLAMESDGSMWRNGHHCVKDRLETSIVLNYTSDFVKTYKNNPHFSFSFISRLTHDVLGNTAAADIPYHNALSQMHESGQLNNTVLFVLSDHGLRFGSFRETYIGRLEDRLPMMYLVFPKWFYKKYPEIAKNLKINQNRLTTPFDIYETLKDVLYFRGNVRGHVDVKQRGISLFEEIPPARTCDHAGILPHWCVCMDLKELSLQDRLFNASVNYVLSEVNKQLQDYGDKCSVLTLDHVKSVQSLQSNEKVLTFVKSQNEVIDIKVSYSKRVESLPVLQLAMSLKPGAGEIEATIRYNEKTGEFQMAGDVSRINKYGHDGDCITNASLRKYCFCKK